MSRASTFDTSAPGFRLLVIAVVVLLHLLFFQALNHGLGGARVTRSPATVFRVEFVERRPRPEVVPAVMAQARTTRRVPEKEPRVARERAPTQRRDMPSASTAPNPAPEAPLVMDWKHGAAGGSGVAQTLPADEGLDAAAIGGPDRFRMRRQLSGKDVIEGAAQLLGTWPAGYTTDPCPRIERNIGALMTDGRPAGRRALAEELRRRKAACRQRS